MAKDYKLCPKCNNALDNNAMQCPYCGENLGITFGSNNYGGSSQNQKILINQAKGSKGCLIFFIIFFALPIIGNILSFIFDIISSFFN